MSLEKIDNLISSLTTKSTSSSMSRDISKKPLLMIPGPIEFEPEVMSVLSKPVPSHVAPSFIKIFSETLKNVRRVLYGGEKSQPFILTGGGSICWDCMTVNLCEPNDRALVLNTGYFSDNYRMCLQSYNVEIDEIQYEIGDIVNVNCSELISKLKNNNYKLIALTDVDTSTSIKNPIKEICQLVRKYSPNSFITVDGVCSFAGAELRFDEWGVDAAMTCSQKAFGVPPGLAIMLYSERAMNYVLNDRSSQVNSWYCNLQRWYPIMRAYEECKVSYFSTPAVGLIMSLNVATNILLKEGMENVFKRHLKVSNAFRRAMKSIGLSFVPIKEAAYAPTITAVKFPPNVNGKEFLGYCKQYGCIFAGGLHKKIKTTYFRVGHMGLSTKYKQRNDVLRCVEAIEYALNKVGYNFNKGDAIQEYKNQLGFSNL